MKNFIKVNIWILASGLFAGLGLSESVFGYLRVSQSANGTPAYYGLSDGFPFYVAAVAIVGYHFYQIRKIRKNKVLSKKP